MGYRRRVILHLHSKTYAEVGLLVSSCIASSGNFPLHPSDAESPRNQDAVYSWYKKEFNVHCYHHTLYTI